MTIFNRECRARLKGTLIWSAISVLLVYLSMWKFGNISSGGPDMTAMFDKMPRILQAFFGMVGLSLTDPREYYGIIHVFLLATGGIFAAMAGAGTLSNEESDKTADFLLTRPVTRTSVLTQKLLVVVLQCLVFCAFTALGSLLSFASAGINAPYPAEMTVAMLAFMLFFAALGLLTAAGCRRPKRAPSLASMALLGFYLISVLCQSSEQLSFLKYLTPFEYVSALRLLEHGLWTPFTALTLVIAAVMLAVAYLLYPKRDINT